LKSRAFSFVLYENGEICPSARNRYYELALIKMMLKIGMNFISEVAGSDARREAPEALHISVSDRRCVC
jgi:hypothetical protein